MRWKVCLCLGLFASCFAWLGCQEQEVKEAAPAAQSLSTAQLLRTPVTSLYPKARGAQPVGRIRLEGVTQLQLHLRGRGKNKSKERYAFYRGAKQWWAIRWASEESAWGHQIDATPFRSLLKALRGLKPATISHLHPTKARTQLFFFTKGRRFLLRIMQAPRETGLGAVYRGEWLIYHQGNLYQQRAHGRLYRAVGRLRRAVRKLRSQRDWLHLPLHSAGLDFRLARKVAQQIGAQRKKLQRCFKKRRFPANIGPLKMRLKFSSEGKVVHRRIETRAHTKHKVVWCIWWHVKQWKVAPFPLPSITYRLEVPPGGP